MTVRDGGLGSRRSVRAPDRWTMHDPKRCGAHEMPEGYPCRCGRFWPRPAAYWRGTTAVGRREVEALIRRWRLESRGATVTVTTGRAR